MKSTMGNEPSDRLTFIADELIEKLRSMPNTDDVKILVMLSDANGGGMGMDGWEDATDATAQMFVHLSAMFAAHGKTLKIIPVRRG